MKNFLIFVYGTLKKGYRNHFYLENALYEGTAVLKDYEMFDLGTYPGIRTHQGSMVEGELYIVDEEMKKHIDELEEEGSLYRCVKVEVLKNNQKVEAYVYEYLLPFEGEVLTRTSW